MIKNIKSTYSILRFVFPCLILLSLNIFPAHSQQDQKMNMDTSVVMQKEMMEMQMLPMAFFTHMGIPLNVGTYGLRLAALPTQKEGDMIIPFNFQFETGLSKTIGLFVGGEGLFDNTTLETMVQFVVLKSKNGMNGFSSIIEFEFPLGPEATRSVYTLVGFATTFSNSHIEFNQVLHYSPLEDLAEGSASVVIKVSKQIFFVSEISGAAQKSTRPIFNLLGGIKVELYKNFLIGFAYQLPLTSNRAFSSQYVFQPNIMF
jgi:hypothetical protein